MKKETYIVWMKEYWQLLAVLLLAALLRFPGFLHGLPTYPDADEAIRARYAVRMFKGDLRPDYFNMPSLHFYANAVIITGVQAVHHGLHFIGLAGPHTPYWMFYAVGRISSICYSLLTVLMAFFIGRAVGGKRFGIFCAILMAVMPLQIWHSVRWVPNPLLTLIVSISTLGGIKHLNTGDTRHLYFSAVFAGLAIGTKYLFFAPVAPIAAKWFVDRRESRTFFDRRLWIMLGIIPLTFFVTTPFALVDMKEFIKDVLFVKSIYKQDHTMVEPSNVFGYFMWFLFFTGATPPLFLLTLAGLVYMCIRKTELCAVVYSVPLLWFILLSTQRVKFSHNIMTISLPLVLGAVILIEHIRSVRVRWILVALLCIWPSILALKRIEVSRRPDLRYVVEKWIEDNIPSGSSIASEEYTAAIDTKRYKWTYLGIFGLAYRTPEMIRHEGFDYIMTYTYDRLYKFPENNAKSIANYEKNLSEFSLVKKFVPGDRYRGGEITILKVE